MVVTGGIGVLVVIAFVAAVAFGRDQTPAPGDRVAVVKSDGPAGFTLLVGRCDEERVNSVEVRNAPNGVPVWRIESAAGSIDRRYVVGQDPPPFGFTVAAPFVPPQSSRLIAEAEIDGVVDREELDTTKLDAERAPKAPCDGDDIGFVSVLFIVGALGVVAAYGVMVRRYLSAR